MREQYGYLRGEMNKEHICVCICTMRRPGLLAKLLKSLETAGSETLYSYSVVVVDNDREKSALSVVDDALARRTLDITYRVVPEPNIAQARNAAVTASRGDYIAFIDDDEMPGKHWLSSHLENIKRSGASASLGPVISYFDTEPPRWLIRGGFCDRPRFPTGTDMPWNKTRTGNVLVDRRLVLQQDPPFDPSYGFGGEDVVFFRTLAKKGARFIWCDEAPVYELVPPERCRATYYLRRAFLQGAISTSYYRDSYTLVDRILIAGKSLAAIVLYTLWLPLALTGGFAGVLQILIKETHHFSRLLTSIGLYRVRNRTIN
jgi:succinoglycan biosynthesis protein ExoM